MSPPSCSSCSTTGGSPTARAAPSTSGTRVVIMTSNIGADRILAHGGRAVRALKDELMGMLRPVPPELLNRIDEIIVFRSLDRDELAEITRLLLGRVARRMRAQDVELDCVRTRRWTTWRTPVSTHSYGRARCGEPSSGCCRGRVRNGCSRARSSPASACGSTYANGRLNVETIPEAVVAGEESETGAHA